MLQFHPFSRILVLLAYPPNAPKIISIFMTNKKKIQKSEFGVLNNVKKHFTVFSL
jgi:hypothetical protein